MSNFIASYKYIPLLMFRLNAGKSIKLREHSVRRSRSFDVLTQGGKVQPKALDPANYAAPNGASMRPLGEMQSNLVAKFKGSDVVVYAIPAGTNLPDDLVLVHEHTDHYSLQPTVEMSVEDLNKKITKFLDRHATRYTRQEWVASFEPNRAAGSSVGGSSRGNDNNASSSPNWHWSDKRQKYYYHNEKGERVYEK